MCLAAVQVDPNPGDRDIEEHIQVLRVPISELKRIMISGEMLLPSVTTCYLAFEVLQSRGLLGNANGNSHAAAQ